MKEFLLHEACSGGLPTLEDVSGSHFTWLVDNHAVLDQNTFKKLRINSVVRVVLTNGVTLGISRLHP